jgi:hypothetical protein
MVRSLVHAGLVRSESRDADHLRLLSSHGGSTESSVGRRSVGETRNAIRLESLGLERLEVGKGMSTPGGIGGDQLSRTNAKRREG